MTQAVAWIDRFAVTAISVLLVAGLPMAAIGFVVHSI